jgi:hypothetical protein
MPASPMSFADVDEVLRSIPSLERAEVERLRGDLVPAAHEPWETIPWHSDLLVARDEAIRSRRPLFLWAMNGHPLGCV